MESKLHINKVEADYNQTARKFEEVGDNVRCYYKLFYSLSQELIDRQQEYIRVRLALLRARMGSRGEGYCGYCHKAHPASYLQLMYRYGTKVVGSSTGSGKERTEDCKEILQVCKSGYEQSLKLSKLDRGTLRSQSHFQVFNAYPAYQSEEGAHYVYFPSSGDKSDVPPDAVDRTEADTTFMHNHSKEYDLPPYIHFTFNGYAMSAFDFPVFAQQNEQKEIVLFDPTKTPE